MERSLKVPRAHAEALEEHEHTEKEQVHTRS